MRHLRGWGEALGGGAGQRRLTHRVSGDGLGFLRDEEEVAVRIGDPPVAMSPELVSRLLYDRGPGALDALEVGVDVFVVGHGGVEHNAPPMRTLIVRVIRIQTAEHQIAVTALDRGMDELPVFPGQGESCSFLLHVFVRIAEPTHGQIAGIRRERSGVVAGCAVPPERKRRLPMRVPQSA